eukprot:CAMPEP_0118905318 /NCGR_PEP_ID=MMETSP1166-20130328/9387_1 /TAXON_ID=1104430 /ORGANISM="Chrysoreinhardia sp, Strain CCMP3193" /LENGTH=260 /DNA_ID=CAMNT_0006844589 /DNA_START=12 /DNA_END=794 /DNA_ORIENTATION=-
MGSKQRRRGKAFSLTKALVVVMAGAACVSLVAWTALRALPPQVALLPPRRRPLVRDKEEKRTCRNTFGQGGGDLVADSAGVVCEGVSLDGDGCCCGGADACDSGCDDEQDHHYQKKGCCETYEHCVACCAKSAPAADVLKRRASHAVLVDAADAWDFCRFKCLTNSGSVLHQNSYRSLRKHCFGLERPTLDLSLSVNSVDPDKPADDVDLDKADPYVSGGGSLGVLFPCRTEGCAVPEQDRAKLKEHRSLRRRSTLTRKE